MPHRDERGVVDQVGLHDRDLVDGAAEDALDVGVQGRTISVRPVQDQRLADAAGGDPRVVPDPQRHHDQGHEGTDHRDGVGAEPGQQPDREGAEVIGDLGLGEFLGPQPDDGQDPEEAEPDTGAGHPRCGEGGGYGEYPHVDAEVGGDEITSAVPRQEHAEDEQGDSQKVGGDEDGGHGGLRVWL